MEINYSKYTIDELREAWSTVDDISYPERAIEIFKLMQQHEQNNHNVQELRETFWDKLLYFFRPRGLNAIPILMDLEMEENAIREKTVRVENLIKQHGN
jgi:hypothetical protein